MNSFIPPGTYSMMCVCHMVLLHPPHSFPHPIQEKQSVMPYSMCVGYVLQWLRFFLACFEKWTLGLKLSNIAITVGLSVPSLSQIPTSPSTFIEILHLDILRCFLISWLQHTTSTHLFHFPYLPRLELPHPSPHLHLTPFNLCLINWTLNSLASFELDLFDHLDCFPVLTLDCS